jgi:MSHA biogenesis protein MshO
MTITPVSHAAQQGFTLVELITVMVITGIIAGMVALFIRVPIQSYVDNVARAELSDVADTSLRRMVRDLRLALPNSVRLSEDKKYIEFLLTKTGGRYLAEEDELGGNVLSFSGTSSNPLVFDIVGTPPAGRQAIVAGDSIVVYNLGPGFYPADAYDCQGTAPNRTCNRATVASVNGNTVTMVDNPFKNQVLTTEAASFPSPTSRFQVVTTPVTYYCNGGTNGQLIRYSGYPIQASQPVNANAAPLSNAAVQARVADRVQECKFSFDGLPNVQRGLVRLSIKFNSGKADEALANETLTLQQSVHVDNAP